MGIDISVAIEYCCVVVTDANTATETSTETVAALTAENARLREQLKESEQTLQRLRQAYTHVLEQLQLAKRRLFMAKAERHEAVPEQLQLDLLMQQAEQIGAQLERAEQTLANGDSHRKTKRGSAATPKGRRNLAESELPLTRVEVTDPELEGKAERIGFEDSLKLGYERGGMRRIQIARAVYKLPTSTDEFSEIITAAAPKELFRRSGSFAAPTTTLRPPPISSPSLLAASCTDSIPRRTSPTSSA